MGSNRLKCPAGQIADGDELPCVPSFSSRPKTSPSVTPYVTGLMCLQPGKTGGEYSIANACNAYASLVARLPRSFLFELMRPLPREIVEKGKGKGSAPDDYVSNIARSAEMLQLRICATRTPYLSWRATTRRPFSRRACMMISPPGTAEAS